MLRVSTKTTAPSRVPVRSSLQSLMTLSPSDIASVQTLPQLLAYRAACTPDAPAYSAFDAVTQTIQGGNSSTVALKGSTEEEQFHGERAAA